MTSLLNLARKWRSKQFDQIVGQPITVRILKNTLYSNNYFPVYLFAGNKGCGKTSTARVFASAINCHRLSEFQKNPRSVQLPCLECVSCVAMSQLQHPDFIEIDAASHTGVDNVRTIIDASSLLPVLGAKKIYLIDEAHMLSKSAFNAFLKILEEPPASVIFMLATTDPHKIIETVRSRCFQLFFDPLSPQELQKHLEMICKAENIQADPQALFLIAQETAGCVRDALNLLEQLRFGHPRITENIVNDNLGYLSEQSIVELHAAIFEGNIAHLIVLLDKQSGQFKSPCSIWLQSKNYLRKKLQESHSSQESIKLIQTLEIVYEYELTLQKSSHQKGLLELMFLAMCRIFSSSSNHSLQVELKTSRSDSIHQAPISQLAPINNTIPTTPARHTASESHILNEWKTFIGQVASLKDPLLVSVFEQAQFKEFNKDEKRIVICFGQNSPFFQEWITESEKKWRPFLESIFCPNIQLIITYDMRTESYQIQKKNEHTPSLPTKNTYTQTYTKVQKTPVDISDKTVWKTSHMLIEAFGGTITELPDDKKIT